MGYFVKNRRAGIKPYGLSIPDGVTLDRPGSNELTAGTMRYNNDTNTMEFWSSTDNEFRSVATVGAVQIVVDDFVGNGATTNFTMSQGVSADSQGVLANDSDQIVIFVGGVFQPGSSYTIAGTSLTFLEAPPNLTLINVIHNTGKIT